ncbi:MAG: AgmX/PglI C-terminal domain-containing protein [Deltaproteobacteria bacterium]|nr:AgmX/PglI C-terminal domain-containing protein [Deltaproteobacteria bacterium]
MKGFLLGLLVAGLAFGGYLAWQHMQSATSPAAAKAPDAGAATAGKRTRRRPRGARRVARGPAAGDGFVAPESEAEPARLSAADLRSVAMGDDLSTPDVLRLDMSNDQELAELSQDQIDERFRSQEGAILECIARARPDLETYVPGRVTIKFRIQRAGTVRGVRVEAPVVLQRNGLFGCIKGVVGRLRFPSAGTSQIVTYPFTLS